MSPLRPADIEQRDFTIAEVGYDPGQVRAFLSTVALAYKELNVGNPSIDIEWQVAAILAEARTMARATIDVALERAADLERQTAAKLEDLSWSADNRASRTRREAIERAEQLLSSAGQGSSETNAADVLTHAREKGLSSLRSAVVSAGRIHDELEGLDSVTSSLRDHLKSDWTSESGRIRVVIVCTSNRCRSPIASEILKRETAVLACENVDVISRGTDAELGYAPPAEARNCAGRLGMDLSQHRSRCLAPTDVVLADLVVAMERRHVHVVRELDPWANVVLLGDLGDADIDVAARPGEGFGLLGQHASKGGGHEIADPRGDSKQAFERCVEEMTPHLRSLARILAEVTGDHHRYPPERFRSRQIAQERGA